VTVREHAEARAAADASNAARAEISNAAWDRVVKLSVSCTDFDAAEALLAAANAAQRRGSVNRGLSLLEQLAEHARLADDPRSEFAALNLSGSWELRRGRVLPAQNAWLRALELANKFKGASDQADVLESLSRLERRRANYLEALTYQKKSLAIRRTQPARNLWRNFVNLAALYEQLELFDLAREHYELAIKESTLRGTPEDAGNAKVQLAGFLNDFGAADADRALTLAQEGLRVALGGTNQARIASAHLQSGRAYVGLGLNDNALAEYRLAYQIALTAQAKSMLAHIQFRWGELDLKRGDPQSALGRIQQAEAAYQDQENRHRLIKVFASLEQIYLTLKRPLDAALAGREHYRLRNEVLGVGPSGKLGELITGFAINEERVRNAELRASGELAAIRRHADQRIMWVSVGASALLALALVLLMWRHQRTKRLYARLHTKEQLLAQAHIELTAKSTELYYASITDALTGLHNRRYAMQRLQEALTEQQSLAVLLIDLDHFKQINDRFGHLAGDHVLSVIAATMREALPPETLLARVGGEEFLVVQTHSSRKEALDLADKLRARVAATLIAVDNTCIQATVSVGVAFLKIGVSASSSDLIRQADSALYAAKSEGRNRICIAS